MHHPLPVASSVIANMALVQVGSARFGFPDDLYRSVSSFERKSKCLETVIIHCDKVRKMCVHKARAGDQRLKTLTVPVSFCCASSPA